MRNMPTTTKLSLELCLDAAASAEEASLLQWAQMHPDDLMDGAKERLIIGNFCIGRCTSFLPSSALLSPRRAAAVTEASTSTDSVDSDKVDKDKADRDKECIEHARQLACEEVQRAKRDTEHAVKDAEQAKRDTEQAKRDADQVVRDAEQAKKDAEQAKRGAEQARREAEAARRDADNASAAAERLLASFHSTEMQRLRDALSDAQRQTERLKGSNHAKGACGEAAVAAVFRRVFDDWSFVNSSAEGAQSDFRLESPRDGSVIAVEVKNKAVVTSGDVTKSVRDVRELLEKLGDGKLAGYAFISLRTANIPHKGSLAIENVHGVPVMWYGIDTSFAENGALTGADAQDMARCARLLADVGRLRSPKADDGKNSAVMERLAQQLKQIDATRQTLGALQDALSASRRHAAAVAATLDASFRDIEAFLRAEGVVVVAASKPDQEKHDNQENQEKHECTSCSRSFGTKGGLATHARRCSNQAAAPVF